MPFTTLCPFTDAAIQLTADRSLQSFGPARQLQSTQVVACALGLLLLVPVTTFALELGEASIKSGLGQSLLVEIPYRLAADERLTSACIGLVPASQSADPLPTYTRVGRISISPTHIEIFGDDRVREPLIGINVDVHCSTAPHFVRSYQLFVDPPARMQLSNRTEVAGARTQSAIDTAAPVAARQPDTTTVIPDATATTTATSNPTASIPTPRTPRAVPSSRARGHAGGNLTQGQTYRVVRGDTLSGIAARIAERPATILQTADAIFAGNPNAFTRGNRDLLQEGRSITIPIMMPATATLPALSAPAPLPAVREAELPTAAPVPSVNLAPVAPSAAPVPATTRSELAPEAPNGAATGRSSAWLTALLALGVVVLLSAPLAFVRRRKQQAAAQAPGEVQKLNPRRLLDPVAGIDVVEVRLARAPSADKPASTRSAAIEPVTDSGAVLPTGRNDLALPVGPIYSVDLDVGAPVEMTERVGWFAARADAAASDDAAVGDETIEENAATARMPDVDVAVTARQPSQSKPDLSDRPIDDDQMTLTIVELELLRQDYETEHTLTQQGSQALRDAVADLKATKAARAATAETSTLETTDSAADSQTARVRTK